MDPNQGIAVIGITHNVYWIDTHVPGVRMVQCRDLLMESQAYLHRRRQCQHHDVITHDMSIALPEVAVL